MRARPSPDRPSTRPRRARRARTAPAPPHDRIERTFRPRAAHGFSAPRSAAISRSTSRAWMSRRRSQSFFPRTSASSIFTRPPLKYSRHGTSVRPFSAARAGQPVDLLAMQQQLARPVRLVVEVRRFLVGRDREVHEPQLAVAQARERLVDRDVAAADRLDLGARQREPDLERLELLVLVARAPVVERRFGRFRRALRFGRGAGRSSSSASDGRVGNARAVPFRAARSTRTSLQRSRARCRPRASPQPRRAITLRRFHFTVPVTTSGSPSGNGRAKAQLHRRGHRALADALRTRTPSLRRAASSRCRRARCRASPGNAAAA